MFCSVSFIHFLCLFLKIWPHESFSMLYIFFYIYCVPTKCVLPSYKRTGWLGVKNTPQAATIMPVTLWTFSMIKNRIRNYSHPQYSWEGSGGGACVYTCVYVGGGRRCGGGGGGWGLDMRALPLSWKDLAKITAHTHTNTPPPPPTHTHITSIPSSPSPSSPKADTSRLWESGDWKWWLCRLRRVDRCIKRTVWPHFIGALKDAPPLCIAQQKWDTKVNTVTTDHARELLATRIIGNTQKN